MDLSRCWPAFQSLCGAPAGRGNCGRAIERMGFGRPGLAVHPTRDRDRRRTPAIPPLADLPPPHRFAPIHRRSTRQCHTGCLLELKTGRHGCGAGDLALPLGPGAKSRGRSAGQLAATPGRCRYWAECYGSDQNYLDGALAHGRPHGGGVDPWCGATQPVVQHVIKFGPCRHAGLTVAMSPSGNACAGRGWRNAASAAGAMTASRRWGVYIEDLGDTGHSRSTGQAARATGKGIVAITFRQDP